MYYEVDGQTGTWSLLITGEEYEAQLNAKPDFAIVCAGVTVSENLSTATALAIYC